MDIPLAERISRLEKDMRAAAKRLEKGRFTWPSGEGASQSLRAEEWNGLVHGLEVRANAGWYRR